MPFIHVRTLPLEPSIEVGPVLEALTREFSDKTGVGLEHVSATWTFFPAGHYAVAGHAAARQPQDSHPMLVDLLVPDFHSPEKIATMLAAVASSLAVHTGVPRENVFVHCWRALTGMVFDGGRVVHW